MSIEHFISNAVKDERALIQPFQIVDFIGILKGNYASLGPRGNRNHEDRRSSPKLQVGTRLPRMRLECNIGNRLPAWRRHWQACGAVDVDLRFLRAVRRRDHKRRIPKKDQPRAIGKPRVPVWLDVPPVLIRMDADSSQVCPRLDKEVINAEIPIREFAKDGQVSTVRRRDHALVSKPFLSHNRTAGRFNRCMRVVDKPAPNDCAERRRICRPFRCWVLVRIVWNASLQDSRSIRRDQRVCPVSIARQLSALRRPARQEVILSHGCRRWSSSRVYDLDIRNKTAAPEPCERTFSPSRADIGDIPAIRARDRIVGIVCGEKRLAGILGHCPKCGYQSRRE
jgi:hypothetical protein